MNRAKHELQEPNVHEYLETKDVDKPVATLQAMHLGVRAVTDTTLAFNSYWSGIFGIYPGTASGNAVGESLHSGWEAELDTKAQNPSMKEASDCAQASCTYWHREGRWARATPMTLQCAMEDESLLNGAALRLAGRSPAYDLWGATQLANSLRGAREL